MNIKIVAEKVCDCNGRAWKVLEVQAEYEGSLPSEYLGSEPHCYKHYENVVCISKSPNAEVGRVYSECTFNEMIATLKKCGENLSRIRSRIREETKDWNGQVTFVI